MRLDELKTFLNKRGYNVDIKRDGVTYNIVVRSQKVEEIANLLASINEPGKFVVSVEFNDVVTGIGELLDIPKIKEQLRLLNDSHDNLSADTAKLGELLYGVEGTMHGNYDKLTQTDDFLKKQAEETWSGLNKKIDELIKSVNDRIDKNSALIETLVEDMGYIKTQPWWKRFLGVK